MTATDAATSRGSTVPVHTRVRRALKDEARDLGLGLLTPLFGILTRICPRGWYASIVGGVTTAARVFGRDPKRDLVIEQTFCRGYGLMRRGWPADVTVTGLEHFRAAHAEGRGVVMWVMGFLDQTPLNLTLADAGYPVCFLFSDNHGVYSPRLLSRVVAAPVLNRAVTRSVDRIVVIPPDGNKRYVRELISVLETEHGTVGMKGDVTDTLGAVQASYRGQATGFPTGAASLAHVTGAPLLTGAALRHDTLEHEVVIDEPIDAPRDRGREVFVHAAVQEYARRLDRRAAAHSDSRPATQFDIA